MHRILLIALVAITLAGCASSKSGSAYTRDQARQEMIVRTGVVESVREVQLEGTKSGVGAAAGAVAGGVGGSHMGGGSGQIVGAVVGAVIGGIAGAAIEEGVTKKAALEITVRLDNGQLTAVVQEGDEIFHAGERVRLLSGAGGTRVTH
ncbi:MAG: outer rane lipoprotein SlyB [Pseudomonadota bacterium]|jgi:outer membrane lipoprotein SlyB|nr:outer rane lipoprotein SlyB [Pseudomonadota bacterium]MDQ5906919.1 outer rane lipoprotein SlyB [Pseudomonadota bacterium]MDQ5916456.1 outer rane lipoprotein SlyB [Pseudomonadota bacterium]MDQ5917592.1 outer rane lipoprotein SlyB [Pseudomonadota bacterium]MDQ5944705.1 outer rane lipoprotein SlyB [Pseudomonadota bacterium]